VSPMAENQTPVPAGKFPRIWDTEGERTIIGETRVSWIVVSERHKNDSWIQRIDEIRQNPSSWIAGHRTGWKELQQNGFIELVSKENPNKNKGYGRDKWFLNESDYMVEAERLKVRAEGLKIIRALESACWEDKISSATLQQIADLIGYKP
jgi:hypothetical protein